VKGLPYSLKRARAGTAPPSASSLAASAAASEHAARVAELEQVSHEHGNDEALAGISNPGSGEVMTAAERSKLGGISPGAQVNRALATEGQATAGSSHAVDMTPLRTRQAIDERLSSQGYVRLRPFGTLAEATAATVKPGELVLVGTPAALVGLWLVTGSSSLTFSASSSAVLLIASPAGL
jgi:hypothetical protein